MKELWTDKYRPKTIDGYVFRDDQQHSQVKQWITGKSIPHLILSGTAGTGKTSMAKMLIHELDVEDMDVMEVNASRETGIDFIRDRIVPFLNTIPWGDFKVVLLDEADRLSSQGQDSLKGIIEQYSPYARFIMTTNKPNMISPPLHSRCLQFHFAKIDQVEFTARVAHVLIEEKIQFDIETLDKYVKITYPDLRKCIGLIQENSINGSLTSAEKADTGIADWKVKMVDLFKEGKIHDARKLLCGTVRSDDMEEIYRWLYDNIDLFGDEEKQQNATLIIKQGLVDHTLVVDPEINLSATLIRLARLDV
jgi:DNA polymerase III delta prime subunit